jgi:hypothetical protein
VKLEVQSVAAFFEATMAALTELGLAVDIRRMPCEIPDAIAFNEDRAPRAYDADAARAYWRAMLQVQRVFLLFRSRFIGKCSPIHLFWGSFDLAVTRFSGRDAPPHPGGMPHVPNAVAREAYSREVSSAGFWAGIDQPAFYSYAYPAPEGFGSARVAPEAAKFDTQLGEFLLPYDAVRSSADPDAALLAFLQSTYEAAARSADPAGARHFPASRNEEVVADHQGGKHQAGVSFRSLERRLLQAGRRKRFRSIAGHVLPSRCVSRHL